MSINKLYNFDILWSGPVNRTGMGKAGTAYIHSLSQLNDENIVLRNPLTDVYYEHIFDAALIQKIATKTINQNFIAFYHGLPKDNEHTPYFKQLSKKSLKNFKVTAWETFPFPKDFLDTLIDNYDKIILPSFFPLNGITDNDILNKFIKIPHFVYQPFTTAFNGYSEIEGINHDKIIIASIFSQFTERKGSDLIPKIIESMDPNKYQFIIKVPSLTDKRNLEYQLSNKNIKYDILFIIDFIPAKNMWSIYKHADYILNLSRGEGFGYEYIEPQVIGTKVLVPYTDGLQYNWSFENTPLTISYNSKIVPVSPITYNQFNIDVNLTQSLWIEPDIESIIQLLNTLDKYNKDEYYLKNNMFFSDYNVKIYYYFEELLQTIENN